MPGNEQAKELPAFTGLTFQLGWGGCRDGTRTVEKPQVTYQVWVRATEKNRQGGAGGRGGVSLPGRDTDYSAAIRKKVRDAGQWSGEEVK